MQAKILIVDDDTNIQSFSKTILQGAGFVVETCASAAEAIATFNKMHPDLVILDIGLPDATGFEACRRMGLGPKSNIPFMFLTARGELQTRLEGFKLGAQDYIQKPFAVEELLARVNVHLRIKKSQDELSRKNYDLEIRNRVRQDLTDMIVHDLKAPLSSIKGTLEMVMSRKLITNNDYQVLLEHAGTAADFMLLMINDLLDVSQAEQVGLEPELAEVELGTLFNKISSLFEGRCQKRGVDLKIKVADGLKTITTDQNLLFRVFVNLISNALEVSRRGQAIDLEALPAGASIKFVVADQGPGVAEKEKSHIFEKYATLNSAGFTKESQGRGIGLTFCRLATQALKGRIWVEDRPGGGSLFNVEIPPASKKV